MAGRLDDELAAAARLSEEESAIAPTVQDEPRRYQRERPRSLGLLLGLLAIVGSLVSLFLYAFKPAAIYAAPVEKVASGSALVGQKVRVEGELVPGSLKKRDQPCEYRFTLKGGGAELPVRYPQCVIPDTFRDVPAGGVQVTVEGSLRGERDFEASLVMAKCTSKYDPKTHQVTENAASTP